MNVGTVIWRAAKAETDCIRRKSIPTPPHHRKMTGVYFSLNFALDAK